MRIVQLSRDYPPAPSGIGDHVARVSLELSRTDDVVVVCDRAIEPAGADVDVHPAIERWDRPGYAAITSAVAGASPDVIVWHYNPFQIGRRGLAPSAGALAKRLARVAPLVVVAHELWYPWGRNGLRGFLWALGQREQIAGVIAASSFVLVTTDARRQTLEARFRTKAGRIAVVAAGATIEPSGPPAGRASLGVPAGAFLLGHVGAIGEGRDLSPAIGALDRLAEAGVDAHLALIGRTGIDPPSHPRVHATGPLPHDAISGVLQACDAYLFAEPTGPVARKTSLLSALAHGLPVIAYSGQAKEPAFRDGENLLLVEPSEDAVTAAATRVATDPALRARLGERGKALAGGPYSWQAIAAGIRDAAAAAVARPR